MHFITMFIRKHFGRDRAPSHLGQEQTASEASGKIDMLSRLRFQARTGDPALTDRHRRDPVFPKK